MNNCEFEWGYLTSIYNLLTFTRYVLLITYSLLIIDKRLNWIYEIISHLSIYYLAILFYLFTCFTYYFYLFISPRTWLSYLLSLRYSFCLRSNVSYVRVPLAVWGEIMSHGHSVRIPVHRDRRQFNLCSMMLGRHWFRFCGIECDQPVFTTLQR